jgi:CMP-N,N'-diacetyllegionaminic acid synthase
MTTDNDARPRVIAVVLGRAGSKGLPGKNALLIGGRPMICHTIDDALAATTVDRVVVSTDGDAIAGAASTMGVEVIRRPSSLAGDTASVSAAARHAVTTAGGEYETVVVLYANVPVRPDDLIDRAVRRLHETGADSVQSYSRVGKHHPDWMVDLDTDGRVRLEHPAPPDRRQDLRPLLLPDGGVIAVTRSSLLESDPTKPHAFFGTDRRGIAVDAGCVVDIDDAFDMAVAETRLRETACRAPGIAGLPA